MTGSVEFLKKHTDLLISYLTRNTYLSTFTDAMGVRNIKTSIPFNYDEVIKKVTEMKKVVDMITSIVFKPHIKTDVEEIVLRSELSSSLNPQSFNKTMKDTKLWRNKNGMMTPEYVHNEVSIDTILTYENAFIALLVSALANEIHDLLNEVTPMVQSLEERFEIKGVTYGNRSLFHAVNTKDYPIKDAFFMEESNSKHALSLIKKLERRIKNIKASEFYRLTSKLHISRDIIPTNILIHDRLYNHCYKYYLENYQKISKDDQVMKETVYYNYVISMILNHLSNNNYYRRFVNRSRHLDFDEDNYDRITFEDITFRNKMFEFVMREDKERLGFYIDVYLLKGDTDIEEELKCQYYFMTSYSYDDTNRSDIDDILKEKRDSGVYEASLITMNNINLVFSNVLNLSIYKKDSSDLIQNMISSISMLFFTDTEIYEHKCPVCGKKNVFHNGSEYECRECGSLYSLVTVHRKETLYIKTLRRKE